VRIDPEILDAMVSNLLDNARHHGGEGVKVRLEARRMRHEARDWLELRVKDSGSGISQANQARIFEPFFTTARHRGGTGLGLAIVKSLVQAHEGTIGLEPSVNGSIFCVRLPL